jgi:hypothetical protein
MGKLHLLPSSLYPVSRDTRQAFVKHSDLSIASTVISSTPSVTSAQSIPTLNINEDPLLLSRHNGVPVAAWAAPVGVVIAIVLVAGTLAFMQRRRLKRERANVISLPNKSGGGRGSNSEINSEKLSLVDAMQVLVRNSDKCRIDDLSTHLPYRSLTWSPRRMSDRSTVVSDNSTDLGQQTRAPAYEEPPRYAYGAVDYRHPPAHQHALARDILGSVSRVAPNLSWPPSTTSITIRPPVPHGLRPSTPSTASCTEGEGSASASIINGYAQSSPLPPTLPMPKFSQSGFQMPSVHSGDRHREDANHAQKGKVLALQPGHDLYERVRQAIGS